MVEKLKLSNEQLNQAVAPELLAKGTPHEVEQIAMKLDAQNKIFALKIEGVSLTIRPRVLLEWLGFLLLLFVALIIIGMVFSG